MKLSKKITHLAAAGLTAAMLGLATQNTLAEEVRFNFSTRLALQNQPEATSPASGTIILNTDSFNGGYSYTSPFTGGVGVTDVGGKISFTINSNNETRTYSSDNLNVTEIYAQNFLGRTFVSVGSQKQDFYISKSFDSTAPISTNRADVLKLAATVFSQKMPNESSDVIIEGQYPGATTAFATPQSTVFSVQTPLNYAKTPEGMAVSCANVFDKAVLKTASALGGATNWATLPSTVDASGLVLKAVVPTDAKASFVELVGPGK